VQQDQDTIAAIATPPGVGAIGIIRVSGPRARAIAHAITGVLPPPKQATHRVFRAADGSPLDKRLVLYFEAPASYTGEDVLELQGHGGPRVLDGVLASVLSHGARPARPGEFTERAFSMADWISLRPKRSPISLTARLRPLHGQPSGL